jgi:hypothetical protein
LSQVQLFGDVQINPDELSTGEILSCGDVAFITMFKTKCITNEKYGDDIIPRMKNKFFTRCSSLGLNNRLGTDYPVDEFIYPYYNMVNEFGYSLIFQRVNEFTNSVSITLLVVKKNGDFIDDQLLGEKHLFYSQEIKQAMNYYFKFLDNTTLEVNFQIWDDTYSNLIENNYAYYSISKNGIAKLLNNPYLIE